MTFVIYALVIANLMLLGALLIGGLLAIRHGDVAAAYPLFAVRDRLIRSVVEDGVPRQDPWLVALYGGVNSILAHSSMIAGPDGWPDAAACGRLMVTAPHLFTSLPALPDTPAPPGITPTLPQLDIALRRLTALHLGFIVQRSSHTRELMRAQRELQVKKAVELRQSLRSRCPQLAAVA